MTKDPLDSTDKVALVTGAASGLGAAVVPLALAIALAASWHATPAAQATRDSDSMGTLVIRVGSKTFVATFLDNAATKAFTALLPLSVTMTELNGNEKFFRLPSSLPAQASTPPSIQAGDLMLYGSNTLVLFYESFSTTYSYTRIAQVDDATGLKPALGSGRVTVVFEMQRAKR